MHKSQHITLFQLNRQNGGKKFDRDVELLDNVCPVCFHLLGEHEMRTSIDSCCLASYTTRACRICNEGHKNCPASRTKYLEDTFELRILRARNEK